MNPSYISSFLNLKPLKRHLWNTCLSVADDEEDTEAGERDADVEEALGEQQQGTHRNG